MRGKNRTWVMPWSLYSCSCGVVITPAWIMASRSMFRPIVRSATNSCAAIRPAVSDGGGTFSVAGPETSSMVSSMLRTTSRSRMPSICALGVNEPLLPGMATVVKLPAAVQTGGLAVLTWNTTHLTWARLVTVTVGDHVAGSDENVGGSCGAMLIDACAGAMPAGRAPRAPMWAGEISMGG